MADSWGSPAVITSAIGVIVSAGAGVVTWLNYKILAGHKEILVKSDFKPVQSSPSALIVRINIRNFSASSWDELYLDIKRPSRVVAACLWGVHVKGFVSPYKYDSFETAFQDLKRQGRIPLGGTLQSVGSNGPALFRREGVPTDSVWREVWIDWSGLTPGDRLSMRITLLSSDAKRRKQVVAVKRIVPERATSPTA